MGSGDEEDVQGFGDFFQEPEGFRPPEKPATFAEHQMRSGQTLKLRLVGSHPLYVRAANNYSSDLQLTTWRDTYFGMPGEPCPTT